MSTNKGQQLLSPILLFVDVENMLDRRVWWAGGLGHGLTRGLRGAPLVSNVLGRYGRAWLARVGWPVL
ncbi:hypothetical protein HanIR_Chr10g0500401 [Helianthus annuus]|nr:hypothetical protein HanIR_Chr10g0500401 [Helianthus annuus]